jgi:pSer/pThr/pTyr-binding forkhead associated (FHA) protein
MGLVRIGRALDNDVCIDNRRVSRYHAQLRWVESSWLIYDLQSTNGTFVDDQRVAPSQPRAVVLGSVVRLGDYAVEVRDGSSG